MRLVAVWSVCSRNLLTNMLHTQSSSKRGVDTYVAHPEMGGDKYLRYLKYLKYLFKIFRCLNMLHIRRAVGTALLTSWIAPDWIGSFKILFSPPLILSVPWLNPRGVSHWPSFYGKHASKEILNLCLVWQWVGLFCWIAVFTGRIFRGSGPSPLEPHWVPQLLSSTGQHIHLRLEQSLEKMDSAGRPLEDTFAHWRKVEQIWQKVTLHHLWNPTGSDNSSELLLSTSTSDLSRVWTNWGTILVVRIIIL